jgi:hypothetical protein
MVLAAGPAKASVWGYGGPGATVRVTATLGGGNSSEEGSIVATVDAAVGTDGTWKAYLPPVVAGSAAHTVTATSGAQSVALTDVLFGAVWVCGGQSNMEYTTGGFPAFPGAQDGVTNATEEIAAAADFPLCARPHAEPSAYHQTVVHACTVYPGQHTPSIVLAQLAPIQLQLARRGLESFVAVDVGCV